MSEHERPLDMVRSGGPNRREALGMMAGAAAGARIDVAALGPDSEQRDRARQYAQRAAVHVSEGQVYEPRFFEPAEWTAVRILVDLIIPADERSGGATDAGVPQFIDFLMAEGDEAQSTAVRGGLAWLDAESRKRFETGFVGTTAENRRAILDDIAWPDRVAPALSHGAQFFNRFRDLTASGYWSSRVGVEDLAYMGNRSVREWNGCPAEQLERLGVERPEAQRPGSR